MISYVIINTIDLPKIDFAQFLDDNENSLTKNVDKTLCILKFKGEVPTSLINVEIVEFQKRKFHTHEQIIALKQIVSSNPAYGWISNLEL